MVLEEINATFGDHNSGVAVAQNSGTIHFTSASYATTRPETPPSPISTVPFPRDPDHVDRGPLIDEIHDKLSVPVARVALVGLGGVG
ncbi:hypothetical protein LTR86_011113 [Recurvomyces mirabilis]|nr:hypothetical protein LTR86_011113 [Recurvomyces mirabilis]